jgi:hypothetical protein
MKVVLKNVIIITVRMYKKHKREIYKPHTIRTKKIVSVPSGPLYV